MKKRVEIGVAVVLGVLLIASVIDSNKKRNTVYFKDNVKISFEEIYIPPVNLYVSPTSEQQTIKSQEQVTQELKEEVQTDEDLDSGVIGEGNTYDVLSEFNYKYIIKDILLRIDIESLPVTVNFLSNMDTFLSGLPQFDASRLSVIQDAGSFEDRCCMVSINGVVYRVTFTLDAFGNIDTLVLEVNE